jgi:hypothetical protein
MANENEPIVPPPSGEIMQKQWTAAHLEAALNQPAPATPVESSPVPPPAAPSED